MVSKVNIEARFSNQMKAVESSVTEFEGALTHLRQAREFVFETRMDSRYGGSPLVTEKMEEDIRKEISTARKLDPKNLQQAIDDLHERLKGEEEKARADKDYAKAKFAVSGVKATFAIGQIVAGDQIGGISGLVSEMQSMWKDAPEAFKKLNTDGVKLAEYVDAVLTLHAVEMAKPVLDQVKEMGRFEARSAFAYHFNMKSEKWAEFQSKTPYDPTRYKADLGLENAASRSLAQLSSGLNDASASLRAAISNGFLAEGQELQQAGKPAATLKEAGWIAKGKRAETGHFSLSEMCVEEFVGQPDGAVSKALSDVNNHLMVSYLERDIARTYSQYMHTKNRDGVAQNPNPILFDEDGFKQSVRNTGLVAQSDSNPLTRTKKVVDLEQLDRELNVCDAILLQAKVQSKIKNDQDSVDACQRERDAITSTRKEIGKMTVAEKIEINDTRKAERGCFGLLQAEIATDWKWQKSTVDFVSLIANARIQRAKSAGGTNEQTVDTSLTKPTK